MDQGSLRLKQYCVAVLIGTIFFLLGLYISFQLRTIITKVTAITQILEDYTVILEQP